MNIADYPNMTKEGRKEFYRKMRRTAYPPALQKEMSYDDFAKRVGMVPDGQ